MIVFYNLKTGIIEGTIEGRIHDEGQLRMWVGDPDETGRIVCQWKATGNGTEFEPEIQRNLFIAFDDKAENIRDYKVNTENGLIERV